jgi:hypothetical protein
LKAQQPRKPLSLNFNRDEYLRELSDVHKRWNEVASSPALEELEDTKDDYAAGDVGSAADIATALNTLAAALNANTAAVNQLLGKLNLSS